MIYYTTDNKMKSYTTNYTDHGKMTGKGHPHRVIQHDHDEPIGEKNCEQWMGEWIKWLVKIPHDKNPMNNSPNPYDKGYESHVIFDEEKNEGVYFMAATVYGEGYHNSYEIIPVGNFHLFIVPFMLFDSPLEYPSMNLEELHSRSIRQVDCLTDISASLDGLGLQCCRVHIEPERKVTVNDIPEKNILGVSKAELEKANFSAEMVGNGYALFLAPLEPGLHRLKYEAYTPNYTLKSEVQLNVRGPEKA